MIAPRAAGPLVAAVTAVTAVLALAGAAAAQPDWLPPEVKARRPRGGGAGPAGEDDACADPLLAPLAPPVRDTGLDRTRGACLAHGVDARARGAAAIDRPEFYGTLGASLLLELRAHVLPDLEVQVGGRAVDHRFAQDAVVTASETSVGPVWVGALIADRRRRLGGRVLRVAYGLRFELPYTDSGYDDTPVAAARTEVAAALGLRRTLALHGRAAALLWLARPPGEVDTRRAFAASTDVVWAPWRVLAAGVGVEGQTGWYGLGLDHALVRGGLRVPLGCRARLDLTGAAPLAGAERTDLVIELGFARDL